VLRRGVARDARTQDYNAIHENLPVFVGEESCAYVPSRIENPSKSSRQSVSLLGDSEPNGFIDSPIPMASSTSRLRRAWLTVVYTHRGISTIRSQFGDGFWGILR